MAAKTDDEWVDDLLARLSDLGAERREAEGLPPYVGIPVGYKTEFEVYRSGIFADLFLADWDITNAYDSFNVASDIDPNFLEAIIRAAVKVYEDEQNRIVADMSGIPATEDEAIVCQHGNRVWVGHECGLCEDA